MYAEHFSIDNIPYGIATSAYHSKPRVVTRLRDKVIFLYELAKSGLLPGISEQIYTLLDNVNSAVQSCILVNSVANYTPKI